MLEDNLQKNSTPEKAFPPSKTGIKAIHRLRTRMGISFVIVTLVIVLLIEALISTAVYFALTRGPILGYIAMTRADQAAKIYALQAAVQANGSALNPETAFETGGPYSLALRQENEPPDISFFNLRVPYIRPGMNPDQTPTFALLVDPQGKVVASSYPDRYPAGGDAFALLPDEASLVRDALGGTPNGSLKESPQARLASVARTVWSRDQQPIGAVIIQTPAGGLADRTLFGSVSNVLIPTGLAWLCLMLPVGLLFGVLTTRGLIRRIERLASATEQYAEGDYSQRVQVRRPDEIGQLEGQFNSMAGQLVESFAQRQAQAEESARREERARIEQELASARYIQQSLLPVEVPSVRGWTITSRYQPARHVGGDLYDFLPLPNDQLGIVIGDATGKGMPAALIMATTSAMLRAAASGSDSPGQVLSLVNDLLQVHIPPATFVTCFIAFLDPSSGTLVYANAGHNLPYLIRDGRVSELRAAGMPLGLMQDMEYSEGRILVAPGDSLLFHTDGLVEAHNPEGLMFGEQHLVDLLSQGDSREDRLPFLLDSLRDFTGPDWEQEDDVTLILLKRQS